MADDARALAVRLHRRRRDAAQADLLPELRVAVVLPARSTPVSVAGPMYSKTSPLPGPLAIWTVLPVRERDAGLVGGVRRRRASRRSASSRSCCAPARCRSRRRRRRRRRRARPRRRRRSRRSSRVLVAVTFTSLGARQLAVGDVGVRPAEDDVRRVRARAAGADAGAEAEAGRDRGGGRDDRDRGAPRRAVTTMSPRGARAWTPCRVGVRDVRLDLVLDLVPRERDADRDRDARRDAERERDARGARDRRDRRRCRSRGRATLPALMPVVRPRRRRCTP